MAERDRVPSPTVVTEGDWLTQRKALLEEEKELTRHLDRVNAARRRLPMVKIEKTYSFEGPTGKVTLLDLFEGRRQLIVYHFMFDPAWEQGCPGCTGYVNALGDLSMLPARNTSFVLISRAGCDATHIPYKGAEALKDLLAGRVQFMFATIPSVIGHIKAGALIPIAVTSPQPSRSLPGIPTVAESGFPGFQAGSWVAMFAPAGTPADVIAALNKAVNDILADKAIESRLVEEGADPVGGSPEKLSAFLRSEYEKWRQVVRDSGAKVE